MTEDQPYNPLNRIHLGGSVRDALLKRPVLALPPDRFSGAGIYALYYSNGFGPYERLTGINRKKPWSVPIYVGEAVPAGSRKGAWISRRNREKFFGSGFLNTPSRSSRQRISIFAISALDIL